MYRYRIVLVSVALLFCAPLFTHAATLAELQAQLQSIMSQIANLTMGTTTPAHMEDTVSCPNLTRNLGRGMKGTDVTQLQQFLISQKLLSSDSVTGFFGAMTEKAVQEWQAKNNIAFSGTPKTTGYGFVGPKTRAAIADCSYLDIPLTILTPVGSGWTSVPVPSSTVEPPQGVTVP